MKLFALLNLPTLPTNLRNGIENAIVGDHMQAISNKKILQIDKTEVNDAVYKRWPLENQYIDYVKEIIPEFNQTNFNIGFQSIKNYSNELSQLHPHTDGKVRGPFCISFILNTGGSNVETLWWKEFGNDLIRSPWSHVWDLNLLERQDSIIFPENNWNIMRTDIIHSVHNIKTNRLSFTIGFFDEKIYYTIIKKYSI